MYTEEQLRQYPYFDRELEEISLGRLLDPLTGVLSRASITGFARSLIAQGTPFTFAILDLDNFKFINDSYGHHTGDKVLSAVAKDLVAFMEGRGVAGRFGGDEMLIINLKELTYAEKKEFFNAMFDHQVMRKNVALEECSPFITGTVGCASYPEDASNFDDLFALVDKTLYRGKTKGRNCHIIYVEEKHKNIEIRQIARRGISATLLSLVRQFELVPGLPNKLRSVMPLLMEELRVTDLYYADSRGVIRSVRNPEIKETVGDIKQVMNDDLFFTNALDQIEKISPQLYAVLRKREVETVLIVRIGMDMETDGYLLCAEAHSHRIWQEDECAILYFLAKLLAARIRIDGEKLEG